MSFIWHSRAIIQLIVVYLAFDRNVCISFQVTGMSMVKRDGQLFNARLRYRAHSGNSRLMEYSKTVISISLNRSGSSYSDTQLTIKMAYRAVLIGDDAYPPAVHVGISISADRFRNGQRAVTYIMVHRETPDPDRVPPRSITHTWIFVRALNLPEPSQNIPRNYFTFK